MPFHPETIFRQHIWQVLSQGSLTATIYSQQLNHMRKEWWLRPAKEVGSIGCWDKAKPSNHIGVVLHHELNRIPAIIRRKSEHDKIAIPIKLFVKSPTWHDILVRNCQ